MPSCKIEPALKDQALNALRTVLKNNTQWIKVHAAEYLIWLHKDIREVEQTYLQEYDRYRNEPKYRIGIARILYQSTTDAAKRNEWLNKVLTVFGDTTSSDRIHAAETLAKLKTSPAIIYPAATHASLNDTSRILQTYTLWATSYGSKEQEEKNKQKFIRMAFTDQDSIIRKISAYVLLKSQNLTLEEWKLFAIKALEEPAANGLRNNLLNTAFVTYPGGNETAFKQIKTAMIEGHEQFTATQRIELAQALAEKGSCEDTRLLSVYLNHGESSGIYDAQDPIGADVQAAAAYAILKIAGREPE